MPEQDTDTLVQEEAPEAFDTTGGEQTVEEGQPLEATPSPEEEGVTETDWKAKYKEDSQGWSDENTKLKNDLKAIRTGRQKSEERIVQAVEDRLGERLTPLLDLAKAQLVASGDIEGLAQIEQKEKDNAAQRTQTTVALLRTTTFKEIGSIFKSLGVDLKTDAEAEEIASRYNEASDNGNVAGLHEAVTSAYRLKNERGQGSIPNEQEGKRGANVPQRKSLPTDMGKGGGGGGIPSMESLLKRDVSKMNLGELRIHEKHIKEAENREVA
jgi:hypothetical protein